MILRIGSYRPAGFRKIVRSQGAPSKCPLATSRPRLDSQNIVAGDLPRRPNWVCGSILPLFWAEPRLGSSVDHEATEPGLTRNENDSDFTSSDMKTIRLVTITMDHPSIIDARLVVAVVAIVPSFTSKP
jgi:hypothetical protein